MNRRMYLLLLFTVDLLEIANKNAFFFFYQRSQDCKICKRAYNPRYNPTPKYLSLLFYFNILKIEK